MPSSSASNGLFWMNARLSGLTGFATRRSIKGDNYIPKCRNPTQRVEFGVNYFAALLGNRSTFTVFFSDSSLPDNRCQAMA